ncbi:hypothetical protein [Haloarcula nitratireducens]|uniref:Uncharacterized protein n=1 Tax=Haloarcula nitratireducens TaxID=2487749 RepID=A0AAW4PKM8_9EURY|nr:hypothetical protein [Halomicroarcula nitratireducens]MBX0298153.1 hypothetical protein [Halomicroarcula nitratireducens]
MVRAILKSGVKFLLKEAGKEIALTAGAAVASATWARVKERFRRKEAVENSDDIVSQ